MTHDLAKPETITALQGENILVRRAGFPDRVFQFRTLMDEGRAELHLVHRAKGRKTVDWPVRQPLVNSIKPLAGQEGVKWEITVK